MARKYTKEDVLKALKREMRMKRYDKREVKKIKDTIRQINKGYFAFD